MAEIDINKWIPGGILPTDHVHRGTNDNTCSRCRTEVPEGQVPLLLWNESGEEMMIYCKDCLGIPKRAEAFDGEGHES